MLLSGRRDAILASPRLPPECRQEACIPRQQTNLVCTGLPSCSGAPPASLLCGWRDELWIGILSEPTQTFARACTTTAETVLAYCWLETPRACVFPEGRDAHTLTTGRIALRPSSHAAEPTVTIKIVAWDKLSPEIGTITVGSAVTSGHLLSAYFMQPR